MMAHTEQQAREIKDQFAARRKRQWLVALVFIPVFMALATAKEGSGTIGGLPADIFLPVFIVVVVGALLFSFWNWRCPACNRYLGKSMGPSFCPKCGVALR